MAMALPFAPVEKQALLEAPDVVTRQELLLTLLKMGLEVRSAAQRRLHPLAAGRPGGEAPP